MWNNKWKDCLCICHATRITPSCENPIKLLRVVLETSYWNHWCSYGKLPKCPHAGKRCPFLSTVSHCVWDLLVLHAKQGAVAILIVQHPQAELQPSRSPLHVHLLPCRFGKNSGQIAFYRKLFPIYGAITTILWSMVPRGVERKPQWHGSLHGSWVNQKPQYYLLIQKLGVDQFLLSKLLFRKRL